MRLPGCTCALLLCSTLGCSDRATIGGLCRVHCAPFDAGHAACARGRCAPDTGMPDAAAVDAGPVCLEGAYALTRKQLDLVLVMDDTASVAPWLPALHDGLDRFLQEPELNGVAIGFQRFDEVCDPQEYEKLIVPIAPLPENAAALQDAIALMLTASTSTTPALGGVVQYARSWAVSHEDDRVAVVLLTDASPGACDGLVGDYDAEAQRIAREGYQGTPSIKTYVIGFGVMDAVKAIAQAGGTEAALISVTPADGEVQAALDNVRNDAQPCAFSWPSGWTLAPSSEVVDTGLDGTQRRYPIYADSSACEQQDGFYVEESTASFPLVACPRSCTGIGAGDRLTLSSACVAP